MKNKCQSGLCENSMKENICYINTNAVKQKHKNKKLKQKKQQKENKKNEQIFKNVGGNLYGCSFIDQKNNRTRSLYNYIFILSMLSTSTKLDASVSISNKKIINQLP